MLGERRPELRVGGDRGVADAVDRLDAVPHPDRVDAPPRTGRPDAGVDLQVEMPVRVTGPGGVVPDHRRLDPLHRHLHLPTPRPHPGGRVPGDPADDLLAARSCAASSAAEISGCRAAASDQVFGPFTITSTNRNAVRVLPEPALRLPGLDVDAGHPLLVGLAVHRARVASTPVAASRRVGRRRRRPRPGSSHPHGTGRAPRRRARPALRRGRTSPRHAPRPPRISPPTRPSTTNGPSRNDAWAARPRATHLRTFVACVPPE